jgi:RNA-directed DNA polymerase
LVVDLTVAGSHFDFLGYRWWRSRKAGLGVGRLISPKSEGTLHAKIQPLTRRANGASMAAIVAKLRPVLRGWSGYFQHASANVLGEIDGWVRGRLRAILRKRCKGRGRARGLEHPRWPDRHFDTRGHFSLKAAQARELSSLRKGAKLC